MCLNKEIGLAEIFPVIEEALNSGGSSVFTVHGTSMEPFFKDGKTAVRVVKPQTELKKYHIVFYRRSNGDFVLHRIVGKKEGGFVCRGDNQIDNEYPVKENDIIGVVTHYNSGKKEKKVCGFKQKIYAFIWVNCLFLHRIKWKFDKRKAK